MHFAGIQKLTLLDYPGTVAATLFFAGCNFKCPFCHNASLVRGMCKEEGIEEEEVLDFLRSRKGLLEGVAITGGEPLLQKELAQFLEKVKEMGYLIKLDTNGSNPELLKELAKEQLINMVAVDVKNSKKLYAKTCGLGNVDISKIEETVCFLMEGSLPFEFRTTLVKGLHTKESVEELSQWIKGDENYFLQKYVDSGDLINDEGLSAFTDEEMEEMLRVARKYVPNVKVRG